MPFNMSSSNFCRLCVNTGLDFKSLYDEHGKFNEVYELMTKYFPKEILNIEEATHLTMICLQCWEHIEDFYNFQQTIVVAQSNLHLNVVRQLEIATSSEKAVTNLTGQDLFHNISATDKREVYICLSESEESDTQINENNTESMNTKDVDIDLTLDDDDDDVPSSNVDTDELADHVFNEHVGSFSDVEFQPELEQIDIDSDSNCSLNKYNKINTPAQTLPVSESVIDNTNLNQECNQHFENGTTGVLQSGAQTQNIGELYINKYIWNQGLKCAICHKMSYRFDILTEHFNETHPSDNIQILCCNHTHIDTNAISIHLMTHFPQKELSCDFCGKIYVRLHYLKCHIRKHHDGEGIQFSNIMSKLCDKEHNKKRQQRPDGRFPCGECGKNTTSLTSLSRHVWLYHQAKFKYKCQACQRTFKENLDLKEHMTVHTGEHLYTCSHCQQKFRYRAGFYEHQKREHGNQTSS